MNQVLNIVNEKLLGHNVILQYKDETLLNADMRNKDMSTLAASIGDAVLLEIAYISELITRDFPKFYEHNLKFPLNIFLLFPS